MSMKMVGLFREGFDGKAEYLPSINDLISQLTGEMKLKVTTYLKGGIPLFDVMGGTRDPFDKSVFIPGGPSLVGDGKWVWHKHLEYFVERYSIGGFQEEFIADVMTKKRVIIEDENMLLLRCEEALLALDEIERKNDKRFS